MAAECLGAAAGADAALMNSASDDPFGQARLGAFKHVLQQLGWTEGRNVQIDTRWGENDIPRERTYAAELVALAPHVILATGTLGVTAVKRETQMIPIVFNSVSDPIGAGIVDDLARPGGNVTGFMNFEYGLSGKWLELLKEIAPRMTRAAVLRDSANPAGIAQFGAIRARASLLGVDVSPIETSDPSEIERAIAAFARSADAGLIVTGSASERYRYLIVPLASRYKLPAVYNNRFEVTNGGLISYGPDLSTCIGSPRATSIASSGARSRLSCQYRRRPSTSW